MSTHVHEIQQYLERLRLVAEEWHRGGRKGLQNRPKGCNVNQGILYPDAPREHVCLPPTCALSVQYMYVTSTKHVRDLCNMRSICVNMSIHV